MAEPPADDIDSVCASLVREYLFRRGFVDVLRVLDEACPPAASATAASTADLVQKLHMVKLYQANHATGEFSFMHSLRWPSAARTHLRSSHFRTL